MIAIWNGRSSRKKICVDPILPLVLADSLIAPLLSYGWKDQEGRKTLLRLCCAPKGIVLNDNRRIPHLFQMCGINGGLPTDSLYIF